MASRLAGGADSANHAVAFAVPASAAGLSMYISAYGAGERDPWDFPLSAKHKMLETLTVFDDVFVPWDHDSAGTAAVDPLPALLLLQHLQQVTGRPEAQGVPRRTYGHTPTVWSAPARPRAP